MMIPTLLKPVIFCMSLLFLCSVPVVGAEQSVDLQMVVSDGTGAGSKKEALHNAFVNAVQQVIGVQVKSETVVENAQLIKDKIYAKSDGYVKKWEEMESRKDGEQEYVKIKAWIGKGELNKELFLNGIDVEQVYDWIGKPRILVVVTDYIDEKPALSSFAQAEIEALLKSKGITVLNSQQLTAIQKRDAALSFDNPDKAAALGARLGAEIVITGKSVANFSRDLDIGGFKQIFYSTHVDVKAYRTSTAEILMSREYTEIPGDADTSAMGKHDAAVRSIQSMVKGNGKDIVYQIVKNWYEGVSKAKSYQVIITGIKNSELTGLIASLNSLQDVASVVKRSYNRGTAEIDIEYNGLQSTLSAAIENYPTVPLTLVSEEPFRISLEVRK
ncbi:MAG: hypothetical protein A2076_06090 [Geobacteraceae bacterium GWC2_53_11]|nr:MAG: hypothetical protein A2076_06090 [Geobacteraceae bacterium GWC2_53_11]